jgi:hypothetical protein
MSINNLSLTNEGFSTPIVDSNSSNLEISTSQIADLGMSATSNSATTNINNVNTTTLPSSNFTINVLEDKNAEIRPLSELSHDEFQRVRIDCATAKAEGKAYELSVIFAQHANSIKWKMRAAKLYPNVGEWYNLPEDILFQKLFKIFPKVGMIDGDCNETVHKSLIRNISDIRLHNLDDVTKYPELNITILNKFEHILNTVGGIRLADFK